MNVVRTSILIDGKRISDHDLAQVSLDQSIGKHHTFEIRLRQDASRGVLAEAAGKWIGKTVSMGFDYQADDSIISSPLKDCFKGIVTSVSLARHSGGSEVVIQGQSPTVVCEDGPNTRSFTDKGVQEIINEVLAPYKGKFPKSPSIEPKINQSVLPYTVQYKESAFAFVARLANTFGEWFYYDGLELFFGKPNGQDSVRLDFDENGLTYFDISVRAAATKQKFVGYDYLKHSTPFSEETPNSPKTNKLGKDVFNASVSDIFSQTLLSPVAPVIETKDLKATAKRHEQISVDEMVMIHGATRNPKLKVGGKIEIRDSSINENFGKFTIIRLTHDIGQGGDYSNHFEAIPEEVETSPLMSLPEPPFCETQLAKVTDVKDDKSLGRIKVKLHWQEGTSETTPWVRVASPYTGKDKGFYIIPEVGDQVLVAFENNHPDKPYVLTGMYNSEAKPEWFDSKNKYKGFKSKGGNKWKFNDDAKSMQIHAPHSILMTAGNTVSIRSGKKDDDSSIVMKEGKEITIKTNGKSDSKILVDAGEGSVTITAKKITLEATELIELNSQKDVKIEGMKSVAVKSIEIKVDGTKSVDTSGAMVNIKGSAMVDVKGAMIKLN